MEWPDYTAPFLPGPTGRHRMASRFPPTAPQQTYYSDINGNLLPLSNNAWPPSDGPVDPYGYPYYSSDPFAAYAYPTSRPTAVLEERIRARRHAASHNDGWDERSVNGRVTRDVNIPHRVRSRSPIRGAPRNTSPDGAVSGDLSDDDFTFESTPSSDDDNIWIDANGVRFSVLGNMKARQSANRNRPEKPSPYQQTSYTIWRSRFAGDAYAEADHFAEIMTRFPPTAPQSGNQGLFEWIHLESRQPSLSSFLDHVQGITNITESDRKLAVALVRQVRRECEHSIPAAAAATQGRYLDWTLTSWYPSYRSPRDHGNSRVKFLCLPYFSLDPYVAHKYSHVTDSHPIRTLLQTRYASTSKVRDMQQAIGQLDYSDGRLCFHVPQIWCLYIENKLLVTSACLSIDEVQRDIIDIDPKNPTSMDHDQSLHVSDKSGRTWILPLASCETWLGFIAHFSSLTTRFEDEYRVTYRGAVQGPDQWQGLMKLAKKQTVRLMLRAGGENIRRTSATTSSSSDEDPTGDGPRYRKTGTDEGPVSLGAMEPLPDTTIPSNPATVPDKTIPRDARDSARTGGVARVRASVKALHLFHLLAAIQSLTSDVNQAGHSKASLASSDRHDGAEKGNVSFTIDTSKLDVKVSQIQRYITLSAGAGYRKCPSHNLSEVEARLVQVQDVVTDAHQNTVPDTDRGSPQARPRREHRGRSRNPQSNRAPPERRRSRSKSYMVVAAEEAAFPYGKPDPEETARRSKRIVKLSKRMFRFFLPLDYRSEMTSKYWGAIKSLLDTPARINVLYEGRHHHRLSSIDHKYLRPIARYLINGPRPGSIQLPIELSRAWFHLLDFWIGWAEDTPRRFTLDLEEELVKLEKQLAIGWDRLFRDRAPSTIEAYEAVLPQGIVSLLINKLTADITGGLPDIQSTYNAYVEKLEQEVQRKPSVRGHQERVTSVRQEIGCVLAVLQDQLACVSKLHSTLTKGQIEVSGLPQRREAYILRNSLASIGDRMQNFRELDERARGIAAFNLFHIESNRDRQEGAILVFTMVTIIFLPLSFVSSFFGMNTSDVRGMTTPQWAFWAAAVPLTAIVVGCSIFVARNIESVKDFWASFADRWRAKQETGGFYPAPPPTAAPAAVQTRNMYDGPREMGSGMTRRRTGYGYGVHATHRHQTYEDF